MERKNIWNNYDETELNNLEKVNEEYRKFPNGPANVINIFDKTGLFIIEDSVPSF